MGDRYLNLVNSPVGSAVASRVGLPKPAVLRRYAEGEPILPGPVRIGAVGKVAPALGKLVAATGVDVRTAETDSDRWGALIFDARAVSTPADLASLRDFFSGRLRSLMSCGRVLVLGR